MHSGPDSRPQIRRSVLHPIRKLAREIHRRSVWQVLAGYLVFTGLAIEVVSFSTRTIGLPLWTPTMAAALLLIGLPVVIATAVAQGGLPGLRIVDVMDPNELEGLTPEEVHVVPEAHPLHGARILTWRNAILGGVSAAALLVTSVVAYLTMWAFGIGPVGSLVAQGVIEPDDPVILADFEVETTDSGLAVTVRDELGRHLSRSRVITLLDRAGLVALGHAVDAPLPSDVALTLAREEGVKAVIDGRIARGERGLLVSAGIVLADGRRMARFEQMVTGAEELDEVVEAISVRLRWRLGESLRAIRADGES